LERFTELAGQLLRPPRNTLLKFLACVPAFRSRLDWRLSGLVDR
jgi:hypothetical protein